MLLRTQPVVGNATWKRLVNTDLRVFSFPGDVGGGCSFYRMIEPARVAEVEGVDITVTTDIPVDGWSEPDGFVNIERINFDADVAIFQRPMLQVIADIIPKLQRKGIACIVELDDDLLAVDKDNIAYRALHPKYSRISNWDWLVLSCQRANLVTTSTPSLAQRYAPHGRYRVLRNRLPESVFDYPKEMGWDGPRLGWSGTVQTHPWDLDECGSQINATLNSYAQDPNFYVVGDGEWVKDKLRLLSNNQVIATGWVDQPRYIETLGLHMDVGIVPLKLDLFNQGKSALKSMEMASQGIPSVVSATSENIWLSEYTGNTVAYKQKQWQQGLKRLLSDNDYWLERSEAVREAVRPMTYENHVEEWIEAWNAAKENLYRKG